VGVSGSDWASTSSLVGVCISAATGELDSVLPPITPDVRLLTRRVQDCSKDGRSLYDPTVDGEGLVVSDVARDSVAGLISRFTGAAAMNVECMDESDKPLLRRVRSSRLVWKSGFPSLGGGWSESITASTCVDILFDAPITSEISAVVDMSAEIGFDRGRTTQLSAGGAILAPAKMLLSCSRRPSLAFLGRG